MFFFNDLMIIDEFKTLVTKFRIYYLMIID